KQAKRIGLDDRAPIAALPADRAIAAARTRSEIDIRREADSAAMAASLIGLQHRCLPKSLELVNETNRILLPPCCQHATVRLRSMRRADRLFHIIQILRRSPRPVTAASLAAELETSKRSVYRDIAALIGQRVPIQGEAGVGYVLEGGFDLPPLMLTSDEIEAAVLGAQWAAGHGDAALARAARDLIAKISAVIPDQFRPLILDA